MEQSPSWEANRFSASQEIPRILWSLKVHYCIHKCPSPVPILSQLDPVHTPTSHFLKSNLNIILPFMPWSSEWSLSLGFPHQNPVDASPRTCYMPCPSYYSWFYHQNNMGWGVQKFLSSYDPYSLLAHLICMCCWVLCIHNIHATYDFYSWSACGASYVSGT
jgi:hypothetical protein